MPSLATFFPTGRGAHILHYSETMSILGNPYHIFYCAPSFAQQANPNAAIGSLVADVPSFNGTLWPGTVVVMKFTDDACTGYEDIGQEDVRNIRAHFALFGRYRIY